MKINIQTPGIKARSELVELVNLKVANRDKPLAVTGNGVEPGGCVEVQFHRFAP